MSKNNNIQVLLFIILTVYSISSIGQNIKINDSSYISLSQDILSKQKDLNPKNNYKVDVYFVGFFFKEIIAITKNYKKIFCDTVSTWDGENLDSYKSIRSFLLTIN